MTGPGEARKFLPDGYEMLRVLGQGGSGWVALAVQTSIGRTVAIKVLHGVGRSSDDIRRLRREGTALAALRHPAIVRVFDLIEAGDDVALVMEYLPGGDLRVALDDDRLAGAELVVVLCDVADALSHAASIGIAHRDVKPGNVLLDHGARAKLADFGLARLGGASTGFRTIADGSLRGTPLYMAPEQIADPGAESCSIDAYAFAVVAYEALTGGYPYPHASMAGLLYAHGFDPPISPRHFVADLPEQVVDALVNGMAKNPTDRASPAELAACFHTVSSEQWDSLVTHRRPDRGSSMTQTSHPVVRRFPLPPSAAAPVAEFAGSPRSGPDRSPSPYQTNGAGQPGAPRTGPRPPPRVSRRRAVTIAILGGAILGVLIGVVLVLVVLR